MSAVRGYRQRRGRSTAAPAIPLPTPTLAWQLRELSAVVERLVLKGAVIEGIVVAGERAAPWLRLRANGFCSRLAGQRAACGRDARGWFEHWTVRLGAMWLRWEVRGPSAPVGGERDTPWRGVRSVRV